jgi:adenylate cyclase
MKSFLTRFGPLTIALVAGLVSAALTFLTYTRTDIFSDSLNYRLELKILDGMFLTRGRVPDVEPQVVIAAGDEKTLQEFGLWGKWDRGEFANVINNLIDAGADVVGFDMVWADRDGIGAADAEQLVAYRSELGLSEGIAAATSEAQRQEYARRAAALEAHIDDATDGSEKLAEAISEHSSRVVLGFIVKPDRSRVLSAEREAEQREARFEALEDYFYGDFGYELKETVSQEAGAAGAETVTVTINTDHGRKVSDLTYIEEAAGGFDIPLARFIEELEYVGSFSAYADPDGVMRALPLVYRYKDKIIPSLALSVASLHYGATPLFLADSSLEQGLSKVIFPADEGRTVHLPVDQKGRLQVNFLGPSRPFSLNDPPDERGVFPHISLVDIARGTFDKEAVRGKIVIVAVTAIGTFDQRVTPFTPIAPGVEVHAAAIQSMVTGDALLRNRDFMLIEMLVAIILALLLGYLYRAVGLFPGLVITLLFSGVWAAVVYVLFLGHSWFHQIPIQGQIVFTWAGITLYGYLTEGREKAQLKKEFSTVLAPTVVDQLLKNPALAGLGGDERELTVMFSDIRGFTSMSEQMTPEGLTQFLNEYLTPMTDILIQRQGTLDKYMGDAIMAFWGAPIAQEDHAARACLAALDMMDKLHELQAKWHTEGKPEIDIGIGLNSGLMRVGFMGSERMRNYTLLGDNVNLGSRLEGINKSYKTNIIISEFTYKAAKDAIYGRVIDAVRVKGKREPVTIYELRGAGRPQAEEADLLKAFAEALRLYQEKKFAEAKARFEALAQKGDATSEVYIGRCEVYLQDPPPDDWDGVYEMKTK